MIDVIDEVLSDKPTFTIKNSAGEILHDNVQIELKTPVIQEGTPINRALFQSIIKDIGEKADIKVGTIVLANADSVTENTLGSYVEADKYYNFNIGFTPSALIIFSFYTLDIYDNSYNEYGHIVPRIGYHRYTDSSDYERDYCWGGVAINGGAYILENVEVFSIKENGFRLHEYYYYKEGSSSKKMLDIGGVDNLFYIAIREHE